MADYYRTLSSDREQVELTYRSELNDRPFAEILAAARQKDLVNEFTTSGIHRDDLVLKIGGYPLRKYGSQGQQKSFLVALKLAQYAIVARERARSRCCCSTICSTNSTPDGSSSSSAWSPTRPSGRSSSPTATRPG